MATTRPGAAPSPAAAVVSTAASDRSRRRRRLALSRDVWASAVAGIVAAAVAIGASELVAGLVPGTPSLVVAAGALVISLQPPGAKDLVANLFGTNDKLALNLLVVAVALLIGAGTGIRARRSPRDAGIVFVGFGAVGFVAANFVLLASPLLSLIDAVVAVAAGLLVLRSLVRLIGGIEGATGAVDRGGAAGPRAVASMPDWDRRSFLFRSAGLMGAAVTAGAFGRYLLERQHPSEAPVSATLPPPTQPAPPLTPDESLSAHGVTPIVVSNDAFYRIDTALLVPQVDVDSWQLKVTGLVDHPLTFTYRELLGMPLFEQYVTIACVSNKVGGHLVGNTLWTGVRLKDVFSMAGVKPAATQIVGRSVDGFTVGFPTAWAMAPSRDPMIAVGMNRSPLPAAHGYPARLIVPGLYGYVSATKWLAEIELTTREAFDAYWVQLGWAKDGPILTQSRIDSPGDGDDVAAGKVDVTGVAWAPDRGVTKVEVKIDDGPWQPALLSRAISKVTWVQWLYPWQAAKGGHTIEVRATDGTGVVQTAERSDPPPDGARGHHRIHVQID